MAEEKQGNRSRVLHLLKYVYEFSDENHQKTIAQLIQELSENDLKGNRITIRHDIDMMVEEGFDIVINDRDRFRKWAERIGINTYTAVNAILTSKGVEQQTYRSCMGLLKLAEKYSDVMLEAACKKALSYTASPSYKSIKNILVTSFEKLTSEVTDTRTTHKARGITRGADYYRR